MGLQESKSKSIISLALYPGSISDKSLNKFEKDPYEKTAANRPNIDKQQGIPHSMSNEMISIP